MTATDPLRPQTWDDYIGQTRLKHTLETSILAAVIDERPLGSVFLYAPPGAGKTSLAEIIAARVGDPILTIPSGSMTMKQVLNAIRSFPGGIIFFDEVHRWSNKDQESLLTLVLEGKLTVDGRYVEHDWLTVIAATTEKAEVIEPLRDRFEITPVFDPYTDDEMAGIVKSIADRVGVTLTPECHMILGKACAGTPRAARNLVLNARDIARAYDKTPTATEVLEYARIDTSGLSHEHYEYLQALKAAGGTCGMSNLRNLLRCSEADLRQLERLLMDQRLIMFESTGRELTAEGWRKVNAGTTGSPRVRVSPRRAAAA